MAREGWITVKAPAGNREPRADQVEMVRLAEEAEKLNKGIHNKKVWIRNIGVLYWREERGE